uniref:Endonuclease/exonuclease/phosphatase domain-containing protein n=1 Tax=Bombyx mori TaxID=7091 RepID=A0A8R2R7H4_BOMMO|nr:uncharacterized protein LOC119631197 [Bombyx mori]
MANYERDLSCDPADARRSQPEGHVYRGLKEAAADIKEAIGILLNRTASDEVAKLQEENSRLRNDMEDLRRRVTALSEQQQRRTSTDAASVVTPAPAPRPTSTHTDDEVERIVRLCMLQCGSMVNARMEAISRRLPAEILRPPLAADTRRRAEEPPRPKPRGKPAEGVKKPVEGAPSSDQPTTAGSKGETWVTVVGRKKARRVAKAASAATHAPGQTAKAVAQPARRAAKGGRKGPEIRAPRSEAVTLTLQPGAAERGVTYQSVIAEAKAKIKLSDLGLQAVTHRQAATGARLFEVAGTTSGSAEKADALAAKMREVLSPEDVRVSRPMKTAEVRIAGLDDSVTSEEVVAAVAEVESVHRTRCGPAIYAPMPPDSAWSGFARPQGGSVFRGAQLQLVFSCREASGTQAGWRGLWRTSQQGQEEEEELKTCRGNLATPPQGNINHCARAQDILLQSMAEWSIHVAAVVAEPYFVPARDNWLGSIDGLVAIIGQTLINPSRAAAGVSPTLRGSSSSWAVVGRYHPRPVLVLGDLNAKSSAWGSPVTDHRGEVLEEWAVTTGLVVLNRGSEYTCVRQRGGSIVDVSFASPSVASRVRDWRVAVEVETLSDHRYIRFDVSAQTASGRQPTAPINDGPRWALKRIDEELLEEAALVQSWIWESTMNSPSTSKRWRCGFEGR